MHTTPDMHSFIEYDEKERGSLRKRNLITFFPSTSLKTSKKRMRKKPLLRDVAGGSRDQMRAREEKSLNVVVYCGAMSPPTGCF